MREFSNSSTSANHAKNPHQVVIKRVAISMTERDTVCLLMNFLGKGRKLSTQVLQDFSMSAATPLTCIRGRYP